jgi:hypothetical protein
MIAAILALSLLAAHSLADELHIPFTLSGNRIVLPVSVGSSRALRILLDSGMSYDGLLIYNPAVGDSLDLPSKRRATIGGAGAGPGQPAWFADSASFRIGQLELHGQRVIVLDSDAFRGFPDDGVTGYSLLGHHVVTIDYGRGELVLRPFGVKPPDGSWTALPLMLKEPGIPWIEMTTSLTGRDTVTLSCYIDLASRETVEFLTRDGQRFATPDGLENVVLGRGLSGDIHGGRGRVAWVRLGPHRLTAVRAAFTPAHVRSKQAGADAVIGNGLLRRFDCIFDYAGRRLYLRPNAGRAEAP